MIKLLRYIRKSLPLVVIMLASALVSPLLQIIGPYKLKDMTNLIAGGMFSPNGIDLDAVKNIGLLLVGIYAAMFALNIINNFVQPFLTAAVTRRMRTQISQKINRLPMGYFNKVQFGDILSRISNDVDTIGHTLNSSIAALVTSITLFFGVMVMMFVTAWQLALVAIGASIIGILLTFTIVKNTQKFFKQQQQQLGALNGYVEEIYTGQSVVAAYNAHDYTKKKFSVSNEKLYNSGWKAHFFGGLMGPLMGFIGNLGYVAVCVVGAALVVNGTLSIGVIAAFMIYVRLFTQPLNQIAQVSRNLQHTSAASERVFQFLEEPEMEKESGGSDFPQTPSNMKTHGDIEFRNCVFGYEPNKPIIKNFSAKISAGQKVAIVGPTGAGKTTVVSLLMRFYELDGGQILIDGIPTTDLTREQVHENFCMVLQDTWLFDGTIYENLSFGLENVNKAQVMNACQVAGIDHLINMLPKGLDTVLDAKTVFSAGEAQLLTIARAVLRDAPILILDEATSNVDTRTEQKVQAAMDKLCAHSRTAFIIAHRLSTIRNADVILVMNDGDIVEQGTHDQLLAKNGKYAELYNSQFASV